MPEYIKTKDLEKSIIDWVKVKPIKPLDYSKSSWQKLWKNDKYRCAISPCKNYATVWDWSTGESQTFYIPGFDIKNTKIKIPPTPKPKDITKDFNKLSRARQDHAYLIKKKISIEGLNIRQDGDKLIIPIYSPEGIIISLQTINETGNKFFKKDCPLGKSYNFPIGGHDKRQVYVCEGFATGVSIHTITTARVYCAFSKGNLDNVVNHCIKKYQKKDKDIVLCLDRDIDKKTRENKTHKTKVKNKRLKVICPEKEGDFNDFQNDPIEKRKLKILDTKTLYKDTKTLYKDTKTLSKDKEKKINLPLIPTLADKEYREAEDSKWLFPEWFKKRGLVLLTGDKGTGKTGVCFDIINGFMGNKTHTTVWKAEHSIKKVAFLYVEREKVFYRKLWEEVYKAPSKNFVAWRWKSEYKLQKTKSFNWTVDNIRLYLERGNLKDCDIIIIDRVDRLVDKIDKKTIIDRLTELDELSEEYNKLFILTRHTSKPTGQDARQFTERTDGFKEWQHVPSVCLFLHKTETKLLLFKQYANECSTNGVMEYSWKKKENGLVVPEFKSYNPDITLADIERIYNPQGNKTQNTKKEQKRSNLYEVFKEHGKFEPHAKKPGTQKKIPCYVLEKQKVMDHFPDLGKNTVLDRLQKYLNGWSDLKGFKKEDKKSLWYCPAEKIF